MKNNYYDIAYNDLLYLEEDYHKTNYNPMVVQMQQIAEKMLKSVLVLVQTNIESLLHSNNLRQIYYSIHDVVPTFELDEMELGYLKAFYFESKYPGENFITVSRTQCTKCLQIMYRVILEVNEFRSENNLETYEVTEKFLKDKSERITSFD